MVEKLQLLNSKQRENPRLHILIGILYQRIHTSVQELMKRKQAYDFFFFEPPKDTRYKSGNEITVALTNIGTPAIIVSGVISVIGI